jgi:hypothetical protein
MEDPTSRKCVDVVVAWYSDEEPSPDVLRYVKELHKVKGKKWELVKYLLGMYDWSKYDYIWIPDNDILRARGTLVDLCTTMKENNIVLGQASLTDKYVTHGILVNIPGAHIHFTNYIEIQAPCFHVSALKLLLPTIMDPIVRSGWGTDLVWGNTLTEMGLKVGVVDSVIMEHTRAFRGRRSIYAPGDINPKLEMDMIMLKNGVPKSYKPRILHVVWM